jgi:hypothetical protein
MTAPQVSALAGRILAGVRMQDVIIAGKAHHCTVSIGGANIDPREAKEGSKIARDQAENAVLQAKRDGRDCFRWLEEVQKVESRVKHRQDCRHCQAHFELELPETDFRTRSSFYCPCCGKTVPKLSTAVVGGATDADSEKPSL